MALIPCLAFVFLMGPWYESFHRERKTMTDNIPPKPPKSFRITLDMPRAEKRLDNVLLVAIRAQNDNLSLREISRVDFKELFNIGKVLIKGQRAKPSSAVAKGITYVDILGFSEAK